MDLTKELNKIQRDAVTTTEGPVLILAGAGSGKTRCLTFRIAYLIEDKKVPAENILAVTFTNKAANEMKERIVALTNQRPPWMGTFHSICARILRRDGHHVGIGPDFVIYDEGDQLSLIKDVCEKLNVDIKNFSPKTILHTISSAKNELLSPLQYQGLARGLFQQTAAGVYVEYQKPYGKIMPWISMI